MASWIPRRLLDEDSDLARIREEYAYNPWLEQDKEPWERRWEEDHAYDPEREER